ncbi:winged helix-turn-helix domain-containing protein [Serratia ficaria]|uniref:winged helix-turn-helix domain-containing protein n=1 Tax=Serratia ficaria TaxID=61651 RepID=UPI00093E4C14|nr:winged helix-turn-helix domain-containing protein [Serratia ficaria]
MKRLTLNLVKNHVGIKDEDDIELRWKEYQLLRLLCLKTPSIVTREDIVNIVWSGTYCNENTINQTIRTLRGKINDESRQIIITVPRVGYLINKNHVGIHYELVTNETKKSSAVDSSNIDHHSLASSLPKKEPNAPLDDTLNTHTYKKMLNDINTVNSIVVNRTTIILVLFLSTFAFSLG